MFIYLFIYALYMGFKILHLSAWGMFSRTETSSMYRQDWKYLSCLMAARVYRFLIKQGFLRRGLSYFFFFLE